ncbi:MAG: aldo/keto reductase [Chloroflexi bacterium]|nr:aldo/keto reductase [Chloroflexota bacterium]
MDKIRLGKTNLMVTRLGFGGIPIQRVTEDEAVAIVHKCLDLGINYFDTANAYTDSEVKIGKAIRGRRDKIILATKSQGRTRQAVEPHLGQSLKALGTDYIDVYQMHNVSNERDFKTIFGPGGAMDFLKEMKKAGVIRHIGVSSHIMDWAQELVKTDCFETMLFALNFVAREAETDLLPLCRQHDVGFIAMKPLSGGVLSDITIPFKYLFQFPDVLSIPGIQKPHEIEEIVELLESGESLTASEEAEMARLQDELGKTFCRRCEYCQPCPEAIPISNVMTMKQIVQRMGKERLFSGMWAEAMDKAGGCTACGDCEGRCPYGLPIVNMIAERSLWYQTERAKWTREKLAT